MFVAFLFLRQRKCMMSIPAAFLGVIMIWSTTPLAIKWSSHVGFLFSVSSRMLLGLLICSALMMLKRLRLPLNRQAIHTYVIVGLSIFMAMTSTYWGAQFISSGLISVLFGLSPIVVSILSAFLLHDHKITLMQWIGMILGVIGLSIIFQHELYASTEGLKGILAILVAVFSQALGSVLLKNSDAKISPLAMTTGGLGVMVILYAILWIVTGQQVPDELPHYAWLSIVYLGIFGSVIGFMMYFYLLKHITPSKLALVTLITPVSALILGQQLNHEQITVSLWIGASVILLGLALFQWGNSISKAVNATRLQLLSCKVRS